MTPEQYAQYLREAEENARRAHSAGIDYTLGMLEGQRRAASKLEDKRYR